eukprot:2811194-Prymnesium_polylepis.1
MTARPDGRLVRSLTLVPQLQLQLRCRRGPHVRAGRGALHRRPGARLRDGARASSVLPMPPAPASPVTHARTPHSRAPLGGQSPASVLWPRPSASSSAHTLAAAAQRARGEGLAVSGKRLVVEIKVRRNPFALQHGARRCRARHGPGRPNE